MIYTITSRIVHNNRTYTLHYHITNMEGTIYRESTFNFITLQEAIDKLTHLLQNQHEDMSS